MIEKFVALKRHVQTRVHIYTAELSGYLTRQEGKEFLDTSKDFLQEIANIYDEQEQKKIFSALSLMTRLQSRQEARTDGAYIFHPLAVASRLVKGMKEKDVTVIVSGLLHDIVEDQPESLSSMWRMRHRRDTLSARNAAFSEIEKRFGSEARDVIDKVSNGSHEEEIERASDGSIQMGSYHTYVMNIFSNEKAFLVKLADFTYNAQITADATASDQKEKYICRYGPLIPIVIEKICNNSYNLTQEEEKKYIEQLRTIWEEMGQPKFTQNTSQKPTL